MRARLPGDRDQSVLCEAVIDRMLDGVHLCCWWWLRTLRPR
jgi:hypothetical protein